MTSYENDLPPEIKEVKDDVKKFKAINAVLNQEGGLILLNALKLDIANDVEAIIGLYKGAELDLRSAVAKLRADLGLLRVLQNSEKNAKIATEELKKLIEAEVA